MSHNINTICPLDLHRTPHQLDGRLTTPAKNLVLFQSFDAYATPENCRKTIAHYSQMVTEKRGACSEKNKALKQIQTEIKKQEKSFEQLTRYMLYMDHHDLWDKNGGTLPGNHSIQFNIGAVEGDIPTRRQLQGIQKALSSQGFEFRDLTCKAPFSSRWRYAANSLGLLRADLSRLEAEHTQMKKELEEIEKVISNVERYMTEIQSRSHSDHSLDQFFRNQPAYFNPLDFLNEED